MSKVHEINWIYNGVSEDGERAFAGRLGHPELPSLRMDNEQFRAVYGAGVKKGDGFTVKTKLSDTTMIGKCFVPMVNNKPARGEKRHILRFETEEQALACVDGLPNTSVLATFNYVDLGNDCEFVPEIREGEAHGEQTSVTEAEAVSQLGL